MLRSELHMARRLVEARAFAMRAHLLNQVFNFGFGKTLLAAFLIVVAHRVVKDFALIFGELHACAHTFGAPAVLAVVAEQARIKFVVRGAANRTSTQGGKHLQLANVRGVCACLHGRFQTLKLAEHMHHAFAQLQGFGERFTQLFFLIGTDLEAGHWQLNGVLFEAVNAREVLRGQEISIDAQVCVTARARPFGQLGVDTFAVHHQRRQQTDVLAFEVFKQLRGNAVGRLRCHSGVVVNAMLRAQLHVQKP